MVFLLLSAGVPAQAGTGFTLQPVKVSHTLAPGDSVSEMITLINESDEDVNLDIAVEDFVPTAGTTDISFVGRAEGNTTVRDWISFGLAPKTVFRKGASHSIPYTIQAPADAEPGSHFGIIFFTGTRINDTGQLQVGTRLGMLIFVTIPGNQLQKGKVLDFSSPKFVQKSPVPFKIKFENTGTVHFEPKGSIVITNIFKKKVGEVPVAGQAVLPTGVRDLTAEWNASGLLLGRYLAKLNITDGEGNELTADQIVFYAFPLRYLIWFIIIVAVIFFGLRFLRKKIKISFSVNK